MPAQEQNTGKWSLDVCSMRDPTVQLPMRGAYQKRSIADNVQQLGEVADWVRHSLNYRKVSLGAESFQSTHRPTFR